MIGGADLTFMRQNIAVSIPNSKISVSNRKLFENMLATSSANKADVPAT